MLHAELKSGRLCLMSRRQARMRTTCPNQAPSIRSGRIVVLAACRNLVGKVGFEPTYFRFQSGRDKPDSPIPRQKLLDEDPYLRPLLGLSAPQIVFRAPVYYLHKTPVL